jgi:hypothetical protein
MEKAGELKLQHEAHTDVAYVDVCDATRGATIDVVDVGEQIGFPVGQVLLRVERDQRVLLGLTIHEFSSFKRRLLRYYRIASIQRGMQLLVNSLRAGIRIAERPVNVCP